MRALRMLVPLGMAVDILERADMSVFCQSGGGGVECQADQLRYPDCPVYFLKGDELLETRVGSLQSKVHCKTLELQLNFHQAMIRYTFRTPGRSALPMPEWHRKCRRYVREWMELMIVEKRRQMQAPPEMWPHLPWRVTTPWLMPIVLWLSKPRDRKCGQEQ